MKLIDVCTPAPERGNEVNVLARQLMPAFDKQQACRRPQHGFTLLELLIVITLLAVISSIGLVAYEGSEDEARKTTTRFEMGEIRKALLQFRKDTGEFPCRVFAEGIYEPDSSEMSQFDFSSLPATPNTADYRAWCSNGYDSLNNTNQADTALSMLRQFPFDLNVPENRDLLWDADLRRGWHGPYLDKNEALKDSLGNNYRLLDPELDFGITYRCRINSTNNGYDETGGVYDCLSPDDADFDPDAHILPANMVRLVSLGPNGRFDSALDYQRIIANDPDYEPCQPPSDSDDIVLCLLR